MNDEMNQLRCYANEIVLKLYQAKEANQIWLLAIACNATMRDLKPDQYRRMIQEEFASLPMQPIATAPDDTDIIGWNKEYGARETRHSLYPVGSIAYEENPEARFWRWLEPKSNWADAWKPTHWMPMPAVSKNEN